MNYDLTISVVVYNAEDTIEKLLNSLFKYTKGLNFKVYVIDNNSTDKTVSVVKKFSDVNLIQTGENRGFGAGHNKILYVDSKYHAVINPDIVFCENTLKILFEYMEQNKECVLSTPKILNADGTEQFLPKKKPSFKYMFLGRLSRLIKPFHKYRDEYTMKNHVFEKPEEIEVSTGAFMFIRTEFFKKINGFDENFFMYLEDFDLCNRLRPFGKIIFCNNTSVIHNWEGGSSKKIKLLKIHISSMIKYFIKQHKQKNI